MARARKTKDKPASSKRPIEQYDHKGQQRKISTPRTASASTSVTRCWPRRKSSMSRRDDAVPMRQMLEYARHAMAIARRWSRADLDSASGRTP
jgi:hypothetical protein